VVSNKRCVLTRVQNRKKSSRLDGLLHANLHTDSEADDDEDVIDNSSEPWLAEFYEYLKTVEDVDIVSWWGVSH
jgi:hypothetical protein